MQPREFNKNVSLRRWLDVAVGWGDGVGAETLPEIE